MTTITSSARFAELPGRKSPFIFDAARDIQRKGFLQFLHDEWRQHGDLFQIQIGSRKMTLAIHPDHVHHISITKRDIYDKRESYDVVRELLLGNGVLTATGEAWRRQRRLMSPFFTPRGVEQFMPIMIRDAQQFIARWQSKDGSAVEMLDEMMFVTASIILRSLFTTDSDETLLELKRDVETMIQFTSTRQNKPVRLPIWLKVGENGRYDRARRRVHAYIQDVIAQRRAMPVERWPDDLLSKLMLARDEETGEAVSDALLRDESITMFFAGHETTARTLTFAWYALAKHPDVARRLHDEIDTVLGDRAPTVEDLKRMPYTLQVIKETLRLYPAAPLYARDAIQDDVIGGKRIAAGSTLILSPFLTHRHPGFWNEPERFDPDRWTPEREAAQHPYAYHPFAAGQRICLGNTFSLFESHVLLAMLARRFAPELADPRHEPQLDMAGTLISRNGMPMRIVRRA
ncbi:MAG: cytochrome P450 [Candidatus Brachytrichaceae bacterium NZ_4S206]|jgi:cytochrome P450